MPCGHSCILLLSPSQCVLPIVLPTQAVLYNSLIQGHGQVKCMKPVYPCKDLYQCIQLMYMASIIVWFIKVASPRQFPRGFPRLTSASRIIWHDQGIFNPKRYTYLSLISCAILQKYTGFERPPSIWPQFLMHFWKSFNEATVTFGYDHYLHSHSPCCFHHRTVDSPHATLWTNQCFTMLHLFMAKMPAFVSLIGFWPSCPQLLITPCYSHEL